MKPEPGDEGYSEWVKHREKVMEMWMAITFIAGTLSLIGLITYRVT